MAKRGEVSADDPVYQKLKNLFNQDYPSFTELVWSCHDETHTLWRDAGKRLIQAGLVRGYDDNNKAMISDDVRRVVLAKTTFKARVAGLK